jgi:hypothetical protein
VRALTALLFVLVFKNRFSPDRVLAQEDRS